MLAADLDAVAAAEICEFGSRDLRAPHAAESGGAGQGAGGYRGGAAAVAGGAGGMPRDREAVARLAEIGS